MRIDCAVVEWFVPELIARPAVGTSCCASTAEAIIASELTFMPGVLDLEVDVGSGIVRIAYDPAVVVTADLSIALAEVGYPPAKVTSSS